MPIAPPSPTDLARVHSAVETLRSVGSEEDARAVQAVLRFTGATLARRSRRGEGDLFSLAGAARALGVTRRTVERWVEAGLLSAVRIDDVRLVPRAELVRFREQAARSPQPPAAVTRKPDPAMVRAVRAGLNQEKVARAHALVRRSDDGDRLSAAEEAELRTLIAEFDDATTKGLREWTDRMAKRA